MEQFKAGVFGLGFHVLFGADWCNTCEEVKRYADEINFKRMDVDVDKTPDISERVGIKRLPTLQIWTYGELQAEYVGSKAIVEAIRPRTMDERSEQERMLELMPDF